MVCFYCFPTGCAIRKISQDLKEGDSRPDGGTENVVAALKKNNKKGISYVDVRLVHRDSISILLKNK